MNYIAYDHHNFWQRPLTNCEPEQVEVTFMWADWPYASHVELIQSMGKKVVTWEHGWGAFCDYKVNNRKPCSDGYLALGENSKQQLIDVGVEPDKILVAGNPVYDKLPKKKEQTGQALYEALHWTHDVQSYNLRQVRNIANTYTDWKWVCKTSDKTGVVGGLYMDEWATNVESPTALGEIKNRLIDFDMIFTPKAGTLDSIARCMGIPVYVIDEEKSFRAGPEDTDIYTPENNYIKLGDKIPKYKHPDMSKEILRPSLPMNLILDWVETL